MRRAREKMKNLVKKLIIVLVLVVISVVLFITGKKHEVYIENNSGMTMKYSINGEPYKTLNEGSKVMAVSKGMNNVIFLKGDKVVEQDLPSKNITIFVREAYNNSEKWYEEVVEE